MSSGGVRVRPALALRATSILVTCPLTAAGVARPFPRADSSCPRSLTGAVRLLAGRFPRTRAPATHPRLHQPGRAELAWPRRSPVRSSPGPAALGEQQHPKGLQRQYGTSNTRCESFNALREAQAPGRGLASGLQPSPCPDSSAGVLPAGTRRVLVPMIRDPCADSRLGGRGLPRWR